MSKPVFISHAVANKVLADRLVDLLETGVGIPDSDIFCSSLENMGIPSGTNFIDFIRKQISEPWVVILLLSEEYFHSHFCLCELGAAWVLSHRIVPLLSPPLEFKDVKAVLTGVQVLKIDDGAGLNQMQEDLIKALGIKGKAFARWEAKRNRFLEEVKQIISEASPRDSFAGEEFTELKSKYDEAVNEIEEMEAEIEEKERLIEKLKRAKDKEQVKEIISESLDEAETFQELVKTAKTSLKSLPSIVNEGLYYHSRDECLPWPNPFDDYRKEQVDQAIEEDYLQGEDEGCVVVEEDPRIKKAISAIWDLRSFVNSIEEESQFRDYYAETYDHRLNFDSRRFWDTHLF